MELKFSTRVAPAIRIHVLLVLYVVVVEQTSHLASSRQRTNEALALELLDDNELF